MKSLLAAGVVLVALSPSAFAAAPRLGGIADRILSADWSTSTSLDDYLFNPISFDTPRGAGFQLEASRLAEVVDAFGGKPQTTTAYGAPVSWLCYDSAGKRTWFVAAELDEDKSPVVTLIAEEAIGKKAPDFGCSKLAEALAPQPGNDLPSLDAALADLARRFGDATPDAQGRVSFTSSSTLGDDGGDWVETKNVFYLVSKGVVTAVAYSQLSER